MSELSAEDREMYLQQRNAALQTAAAIEKRLDLHRIEQCPNCQHTFDPGSSDKRKARRKRAAMQE